MKGGSSCPELVVPPAPPPHLTGHGRRCREERLELVELQQREVAERGRSGRRPPSAGRAPAAPRGPRGAGGSRWSSTARGLGATAPRHGAPAASWPWVVGIGGDGSRASSPAASRSAASSWRGGSTVTPPRPAVAHPVDGGQWHGGSLSQASTPRSHSLTHREPKCSRRKSSKPSRNAARLGPAVARRSDRARRSTPVVERLAQLRRSRRRVATAPTSPTRARPSRPRRDRRWPARRGRGRRAAAATTDDRPMGIEPTAVMNMCSAISSLLAGGEQRLGEAEQLQVAHRPEVRDAAAAPGPHRGPLLVELGERIDVECTNRSSA